MYYVHKNLFEFSETEKKQALDQSFRDILLKLVVSN